MESLALDVIVQISKKLNPFDLYEFSKTSCFIRDTLRRDPSLKQNLDLMKQLKKDPFYYHLFKYGQTTFSSIPLQKYMLDIQQFPYKTFLIFYFMTLSDCMFLDPEVMKKFILWDYRTHVFGASKKRKISIHIAPSSKQVKNPKKEFVEIDVRRYNEGCMEANSVLEICRYSDKLFLTMNVDAKKAKNYIFHFLDKMVEYYCDFSKEYLNTVKYHYGNGISEYDYQMDSFVDYKTISVFGMDLKKIVLSVFKQSINVDEQKIEENYEDFSMCSTDLDINLFSLLEKMYFDNDIFFNSYGRIVNKKISNKFPH